MTLYVPTTTRASAVRRTLRTKPRSAQHAATDLPAITQTGTLRGLRSVLLLIDAENLVLSACDLKSWFDFDRLNIAFTQGRDGLITDCHAVYSEVERDVPMRAHLTRRGWIPTPRPPIALPKGHDKSQHRNADNWFAFEAAHLLSQRPYEALVIGTGDGVLGLDVARCVRDRYPSVQTVATLSVKSSMSSLLCAAQCKEIDLNIQVGSDVIRRGH